MLVADIHALETVYTLYLAQHIVLHCTDSLDLEQIVRVHATFCQFISGLQFLAVHNLDTGAVRNQVRLAFTRFLVGDDDLSLLLGILNHRGSAKLSDDRQSFRLSRLKKFFYTGKTLGDIVTGNASRMEGTHGQLGSGFTNGLCGNDSNRFTHLHRFTRCHVGSVALRADSIMRTAAQNRTNLHLLDRLALLIHAYA